MRGWPWRMLCVLLLVSVASEARAQDWGQPWSDPRDRPPRVDLSATIGPLVATDWSDLVLLGSISPVSGVLEQVLVRDLSVEPDVAWSGAFTYWQGRYGFRALAGLSRSTLEIGGAPLDGTPAGVSNFAVDLDTWFYEVRGAIGLLEYFPGRRVWPYAFVGFGGITYDLERPVTPPLLTFIERVPTRPGDNGDIIVIEDDGREFLLGVDELRLETVPALNFGIGTDFRIPFGPAGLGVRLEVSDRVANSPVVLRIRELPRSGGLTSLDTVRFGRVHHLQITAGVLVQIGR